MQDTLHFPDFDQMSIGTPCKSYHSTISVSSLQWVIVSHQGFVFVSFTYVMCGI